MFLGAEKPPLVKTIQIITVKQIKQLNIEMQKSTKTCFLHLKMSNFGQGVQMVTA
jgi:hypothetical protein